MIKVVCMKAGKMVARDVMIIRDCLSQANALNADLMLMFLAGGRYVLNPG